MQLVIHYINIIVGKYRYIKNSKRNLLPISVSIYVCKPTINVSDDLLLERFLQHSKNSMERTKEKLDAFYSVRNIVPEYFTERDPLSPELVEASKVVLVFS